MAHNPQPAPAAVALFVLLLLSGCGSGGSGGSSPGNTNTAPVADAGPGRNVLGAEFVQLNGSASDADAGDSLTFLWTQTAGPDVVLNGATTLTPTFVAPAVANVGGGGGGTITLSGKLQYEFVPPNANCRGLDYNATETRPIRRASVQALDRSAATVLTFQLAVTDSSGARAIDSVDVQVGGLLAAGASDDNGGYALTVPEDTDMSLRVRAELLRSEAPGWDVQVRDNTLNTDLVLAERPLYVLDGSAFHTGTTNVTRNLTAETGWTGSGYTRPRAAAPFAILDSIYTAMQLVRTAEADAAFPPLDVFWSVNNTAAEGEGTFGDNVDLGEIGTSFFAAGIDSLFLLGKADVDTEEFDDHVIAHEWGHYFEDVFSRSDSVGGAHGFGDRLDMRVAFGEGWATAFSGMALGDTYCDTQGQGQAGGFMIDIEGETESGSVDPLGWFNEFSVMALIYDLWDDNVVPEATAGDSGSLGFAPIYRTMRDRQFVTAAHTSIFTFTEELRAEAPGSEPLIDSLRSHHGINGSGLYGAGETNDSQPGGEAPDVLPVYTAITPDGSPVNICSNRQFDSSDAEGNKLSEFRFLRMTITAQARYRFHVVTDANTRAELPADDPEDDRDQSDPDLRFYRNGALQNRNGQGESGVANEELFVTPNELMPGDYVIDLVEWRYLDEETASTFPSRSCFDVTIEPAS